jgi:hypothetical protein
LKVGDKFTLCVKENSYNCIIANISDYREPSMKYAIDFYKNGIFIDTYFAGDEFFIKNENNISKE